MTDEYKEIWDRHLQSNPLKRITKKIKGQQYARPFVVKDGYFWVINDIHLGNIKFSTEMEDMRRRIFTAFKIPKELIQSSGDMLGKNLITKLGDGNTDIKIVKDSEYGVSPLAQYLKILNK